MDDILHAVGRIAKDRGVSRAQVALAWVLSRPEVTAPVIGATRAGHLVDAVAATDLELTAEELASLEAPYRPVPLHGF